ncbi:MAG: tRNA (adenosine(37)-N6)-dimethylallyltransferase MiaA [Actinomycetales bacterium]|nr:tRNA (adenosine(37)-N6)-dimethylallyltransferase MiaA [Actinomycetales bacterium]
MAVVGATGTGKSELALDLAESLAAEGRPAEIVNADAMQLYRGMDVGTAKLPIGARRGIPHHLLDVLDPREEASVAAYQGEARAAIAAIHERGAVAILVGGSGLYVSSVLYDFRFPGTDESVRARWEARLEAEGPGVLHRELARRDPAAATAIGPHNGRRLVRALEVGEITGESFGGGLDAEQRPWRPAVVLALREERSTLVPRLDARVEQMWRDGLVAEARALREHGLGATASRAIGYAQALAQLAGELDEAEAIAQTQALTRRYARRQVSWFRRSPVTAWIPAADPERVRQARAAVDAGASVDTLEG